MFVASVVADGGKGGGKKGHDKGKGKKGAQQLEQEVSQKCQQSSLLRVRVIVLGLGYVIPVYHYILS